MEELSLVSALFGSKVSLVAESSQFLRRTQLVVVAAHSLCLLDQPLAPILRLSVSSFLLGMVFSEAGSVWEGPTPPVRAHGVRGVSTSVAVLRNWFG